MILTARLEIELDAEVAGSVFLLLHLCRYFFEDVLLCLMRLFSICGSLRGGELLVRVFFYTSCLAVTTSRESWGREGSVTMEKGMIASTHGGVGEGMHAILTRMK